MLHDKPENDASVGPAATALSRLTRTDQAAPFVPEDGEILGHGLLQRIALREKGRLQVELLRALHALPLSRHITLVGGAALHGVYLHRRWSKDLDFEMPYVVARRFAEALRDAGFATERTETNRLLAYSGKGAFFPEMALGIEVFLQPERVFPAELGLFTTTDGTNAPVRCQPFAELMATKLGCLFRRSRCVDYADLWSGLLHAPDVRTRVVEILNHPRWNCSSFTPPRPYPVREALRRLGRLEAEWEEALKLVFFPVPPFAEVQRDLADLLSFFEAPAPAPIAFPPPDAIGRLRSDAP